MQREDIGLPPTPDQPVPSYYKYPEPNGQYWLYYNGETWVGEPVALAWWLRPLSWARGRAPAWTVLATVALCVACVAVYFVIKR